jgi:hypothetical protein
MRENPPLFSVLTPKKVVNCFSTTGKQTTKNALNAWILYQHGEILWQGVCTGNDTILAETYRTEQIR